MTPPQVFVAGTWRDDLPDEFAAAARRVGVLIAEAGCSLACGPGTGAAGHAVAGFRSVADRKGVVRYYLPSPEAMAAAGEEVRQGADEVEQTSFDYPMRNVHQIGRSAGVVVVTGGDGTLEEILPALIDYGLPVGALRGSGKAAKALELLLDVFPDWRPSVLLGDVPDEIAEWVLGQLEWGKP